MIEDHTGVNLGDIMTDTWELDVEKQTCITTDNGTNLIYACSNLRWTRLYCIGHNLPHHSLKS